MIQPKMKFTCLCFVFIIFVVACSQKKADLVKEEKVIRDLLLRERKAHFDRNADLFIGEFSDSMLSVNKGVVMRATPQERRKRIQGYFNSAEFIKWDDMAEPVIRFSDDATLAYAIIQKEVIVNRRDSAGRSSIDTSHYAWTSIYRKQKGEWKVECNVSTNR